MSRCVNSDEKEGNILVGCCRRLSRASSFVLDAVTVSSLSNLACVAVIMVSSLGCPCVGGLVTAFHGQTLTNPLLRSGNSKRSLCGAFLRNTRSRMMQPMHTFSRLDWIFLLPLSGMLPQLVTTGCHECLVFQRKNFTLAFSAAESVGIPSSLVSGLSFLTECCL